MRPIYPWKAMDQVHFGQKSEPVSSAPPQVDEPEPPLTDEEQLYCRFRDIQRLLKEEKLVVERVSVPLGITTRSSRQRWNQTNGIQATLHNREDGRRFRVELTIGLSPGKSRDFLMYTPDDMKVVYKLEGRIVFGWDRGADPATRFDSPVSSDIVLLGEASETRKALVGAIFKFWHAELAALEKRAQPGRRN